MGYGGETSDVIRDEKEEKNTKLERKITSNPKTKFYNQLFVTNFSLTNFFKIL
jgi:hypothetical protein